MHWLVDPDIRSFFDRTPHRRLLTRFRQFVRDPRLNGLVSQWLAIGTYTQGFFSGACGIPQGSVISPVSCNLYLHDFEQALSRAALPFVRYADDFLIFAPDQLTATQALRFVQRQLKSLDLELHPEKTRIVRAGPEVSFLGSALPAHPTDLKPRTGQRRLPSD